MTIAPCTAEMLLEPPAPPPPEDPPSTGGPGSGDVSAFDLFQVTKPTQTTVHHLGPRVGVGAHRNFGVCQIAAEGDSSEEEEKAAGGGIFGSRLSFGFGKKSGGKSGGDPALAKAKKAEKKRSEEPLTVQTHTTRHISVYREGSI